VAKKIYKHLKKFLPLIGIAILLYLIYNLGIENIKNAFLSIHPIYIIIALSLTLPRILIRNYSWQILQKEQKIEISYWKSLKIFLIGFFYCSITPAFLGHLMRVPYMKEETKQPYGKLFTNVMLEVILRSFTLYSMITIGFIFFIEKSAEMSNLFWIWVTVLAITAIILFYFVKKERGEKLFNALIKYLIPKNLKKDMQSFADTFYHDFPRIRTLIIPIILGAITWIIAFTQEYIVVIALGLDIPYFYFLLLFPLANVVGFIPITFAGIGTREAAAIFIFTTLFTVEPAEIFVVSLMGFIITDIFTGLIGFIVTVFEEMKNKPSKLAKS